MRPMRPDKGHGRVRRLFPLPPYMDSRGKPCPTARGLGVDLTEPRSRYEPDGPCDPEFPCVPELPCVPAALAACLAACAAAFACRCASELVRPGLSGFTFSSAS